MILYLLKKNFCDGWDNMLSLIVPNIVMTLVSVALWALYGTVNASGNMALGMLFTLVFFFFFLALLFAFGENAVRIANFGAGSVKDYFSQIVPCAKEGALFGLICGLFTIFASVGIPYYMSLSRGGNMIGIFLASCVFWFVLIAALSLQWFIPIKMTLKDPFRVALKKSLFIFFDNPLLSLFMFVYHGIMLFLSAFLLGSAPGATGILLSLSNALKILLYKYDYLDAHPELKGRKRRNIPWSDLLKADKETLGPRTIRSFIFPWKD